MSRAPDSAIPIVAYKTLQVRQDGIAYKLWSSHGSYIWTPGWNKATCQHGSHRRSPCVPPFSLARSPGAEWDPSGTPDGRVCGCGFYAVGEKEIPNLWRASSAVIVMLELAGKVVEHEFGYRSEYAKVVAVKEPGVNVHPQAVAGLARTYPGLKVFPFSPAGGLEDWQRLVSRLVNASKATGASAFAPIQYSTTTTSAKLARMTKMVEMMGTGQPSRIVYSGISGGSISSDNEDQAPPDLLEDESDLLGDDEKQPSFWMRLLSGMHLRKPKN